MPYTLTRALVLSALIALPSCATTPGEPALSETQERYWNALTSHCGKTYMGQLVSEDKRDSDLRGRPMQVHWAECSDTRVAIAFRIENPGFIARVDKTDRWDRSRTWIITRTADGLRLKHDHRHSDGSEDAVTQYGGDTVTAGTARAQDFPVDADSIALFKREGLDASVTNIWRVEVDPAGMEDARFAYQLTRRNDPSRLFRVEFDLSDRDASPLPALFREL